eukprot:GAHX01000629.1.p1 GENE.GAHX01000629.1~~GAHX01000629.1.p1  ORF type:complete len:343 (-),score=37.80 GAHX01000629.1:35-1063(-)
MSSETEKTTRSVTDSSESGKTLTKHDLTFFQANRKAILSITSLVLFFTSSTTLMTFLPKVIKQDNFIFISIINLSQIIFALFVIHLGILLGFFKFSAEINMAKAKRYFPLAFVFTALIYTGNAPFYSQSITTNATIKRLVVIPTILLQWYILSMKPNPNEIISVSIIVTGALLLCFSDKGVSVLSYILCTFNILFAALYNILVHLYCKGEDPFSVMYYMNILSVPIYLVGIIIEFFVLGRGIIISFRLSGFYWQFTITACFGIFYNIFAFLANKYNKPLTIIIAGNLKNSFVIVWEIITSVDVRFGKGPTFYIGVAISALGSMLYGILKFFNKNKTEKNKKV